MAKLHYSITHHGVHVIEINQTLQWISVVLENSMEEVSCPDNINSVYCLLSGHETLSTEFSNATEIHCSCAFAAPYPYCIKEKPGTKATQVQHFYFGDDL